MIEIPNPITFEAAIAASQSLLDRMEEGQISEDEIGKTVSALVNTANGVRGFFVTYLTDSRPFADNPTPAVIQALQSSPDTVTEFAIKNLAMSTAMEITHHRNGDSELEQQSAQVRDRSTTLLKLLNCDRIYSEAKALYQSITTTSGTYATFLKKWGYDAEQKQAIASRLEVVFPELSAIS
ncbi:MAG: hypothetical protein HC852_07680 [Acaryochloridaceae cyanobacterium RU_4_10]|nr:hypothetical protein [Acaryochloridaceae cyanobacterium RU_4_10]